MVDELPKVVADSGGVGAIGQVPSSHEHVNPAGLSQCVKYWFVALAWPAKAIGQRTRHRVSSSRNKRMNSENRTALAKQPCNPFKVHRDFARPKAIAWVIRLFRDARRLRCERQKL